MLKSALLYILIALLVDQAAFDGYYRRHVVQESVDFWGRFSALDWGGFTT